MGDKGSISTQSLLHRAWTGVGIQRDKSNPSLTGSRSLGQAGGSGKGRLVMEACVQKMLSENLGDGRWGGEGV